METQNRKSILRVPLLLLVCVVLFCFGVGAVSAAGTSGNSTIYVSTDGNDTWDGLSPVYNTTSGPKKTIKNATGTVAANGTVYIAPGTYTEYWIVIDRDMTITGANQKNTIINGQQSGNSIFKILPGITVNINNLTLTNNSANLGGAIYNWGSLTVMNCTLTNNNANVGGALFNWGSLTVMNCTFTNNSAGNGGGAIYNYWGVLAVMNCTFTNNSAKYYGGAIWSCVAEGSGGVVHFNRIVGNSQSNSQIYSGSGVVDARFNWWGSNFDPSGYVSNGYGGSVDVSSWLVLNIRVDPANGGNSIVTVDLLHDNTGVYHDPVNGHVPDGIVVYFASDRGILKPVSMVLVNGSATSVFTATSMGSGNITATVDNQKVSTPITINQAPTTVIVDPVSGHAGQNVALKAHVTDLNGNAVTDGRVTFRVNGIVIGGGDVSNGLATVNWTIPTTWTSGVYGVAAEYSGSANYLVSTNTTNLTVTPISTSVIVDPVGGYAGQNVALKAHVTDLNGNAVTDGRVTFRVNGIVIGGGDVSNGLATVNWTIPTTWTSGVYNITAEYMGSSNYLASVNGTFLTLEPSAYLYMNVTGSKVNPVVGDKFVLTYKLSNGGPDNATNVVISFQIPTGLEFVSASVDSGTYVYNPVNRTITWMLSDVGVGDPYLYLTLRALGSGKYIILPTISSETFNRNTDALKPFVINVESQNNSNNDSGNNDSPADSTVVDAASDTVVMHNTGMPLVGFVLAILAVLGGMFTPRRK